MSKFSPFSVPEVQLRGMGALCSVQRVQLLYTIWRGVCVCPNIRRFLDWLLWFPCFWVLEINETFFQITQKSRGVFSRLFETFNNICNRSILFFIRCFRIHILIIPKVAWKTNVYFYNKIAGCLGAPGRVSFFPLTGLGEVSVPPHRAGTRGLCPWWGKGAWAQIASYHWSRQNCWVWRGRPYPTLFLWCQT